MADGGQTEGRRCQTRAGTVTEIVYSWHRGGLGCWKRHRRFRQSRTLHRVAMVPVSSNQFDDRRRYFERNTNQFVRLRRLAQNQ